MEKLKLKDILKAKNPYLFRAKNILTGHDLIKTLLNVYLSSQEESIFGEFLQGLVIFVCDEVLGSKKSAAEDLDLKFQKDRIFYWVLSNLVQIGETPGRFGIYLKHSRRQNEFLEPITHMQT